MGGWVGAEVVAVALGVRPQAVRRRAHREGWPVKFIRANGGRKMQIYSDELPIEIRNCIPNRDRKDEAPGTPPTPPASAPRSSRYASLAEAPRCYKEIARARANILDQWRRRARVQGVRLRDAVDPAWGVSTSTLWRWRRFYRAEGLAGLIPRWTGPAPAIPDGAWDIFRGIYLDQNRVSAQFAYERMLAIYEAKGGDVAAVPRVSAFRRRLKTEPEAALILFREGRKSYYDHAEPFLSRTYDMPAGDHYVADHHMLDFLARTASGRPGRLWITAWRDMRSTKIVGWAVCEKPSTDSVLAAFAAAVTRNGCPKEAWMDRGKDFESKEIAGATKKERRKARSALSPSKGKPWGKPEIDEGWVAPIMAELGVDCHYSIPYNARAKPIERTFRTLADRFARQWPSYVGPATDKKPETAKEFLKAGAVLPDVLEVSRALDEWIAWFNARVKKGGRLKGLSPDAAFEKFRGDVRPPRESLIPVLAMRTEKQQVKRNGVSILKGLFFWNEHLHVERLGAWVVVRYNPADLSRVFVFDLDGSLFTTVERSDLDNVSRQDVGKAMARQRRAKKLLRERYAPQPVDWKYSVGNAAPPPTGSTATKVPRGGRGFDLSTLDQELMAGLEETGT
ncbi:MAG TPA: Mu transposase C-terminal domain-containing protein [Sumerlaeia bacterium]|nr:Mu transposase C-terminal domain-containing protein [Sumerlaeia bacterium]